MRQVKRGIVAFFALEAASVAVSLLLGGTLGAYLDVSFLVGLAAVVGSGLYYLSGQRAFAGVGIAFQKFGYAIVELFSKADHTEQRRALNAKNYTCKDIRKDCEFLVASVLIILLDFLIIYIL